MPNPEAEKPKEFSREEMIKYGREHYGEYCVGERLPEDLMKILDRVHEANKRTEERLYRMEYRERIIRFLQERDDEELENIFSRQNFDWEAASRDLSEEGMLAMANKIVIKDESFTKAVREREENGMEFSGFEEDRDLEDIKADLEHVFGKELMCKCLISEINYRPEIVHVWFGNLKDNWYLPADKYEEWKEEMLEIIEHKVRAENFGNWNANHNFSHTYLSYPLKMYSFVDEDLSRFEYLNGLPDDKKMRYYKIGTVTHEFGHNIYYNLINSELRKEWQEIVDASEGSLTSYADKYRSGTHGNEVNYGEEFAEAMRLLTTTPEYLENKNSEVYEFLRSKFPEIKGLEE